MRLQGSGWTRPARQTRLQSFILPIPLAILGTAAWWGAQRVKIRLDASVGGPVGWGGEGGKGTPLRAQFGSPQPPPPLPAQCHESIASEVGSGCTFVVQVAPVGIKHERGGEARRASICGRQQRKERTRVHHETDEVQAPDLDSDSSSTANASAAVRCLYHELVRSRSGSAETEKTGIFSRHGETPAHISAQQDSLSAIFRSLSTHAAGTSSAPSHCLKSSGAAGRTLSSFVKIYGIDMQVATCQK